MACRPPAPTWQAGAGVPQSEAGGGAGEGRGVPDVAGNADPVTGYLVVVDGQVQPIGGTSAVAPLWARLVSRLAQATGRASVVRELVPDGLGRDRVGGGVADEGVLGAVGKPETSTEEYLGALFTSSPPAARQDRRRSGACTPGPRTGTRPSPGRSARRSTTPSAAHLILFQHHAEFAADVTEFLG
jgi:kumamolisin